MVELHVLDTLRRVIDYQREQRVPPLVLAADRVFEWAPGFGSSECCDDWYEVYPDDLSESVRARLEPLTAHVRDHELELSGRVGLDAAGRAADTNATRELYDAMAQVARTGRAPLEQHPSIGCAIKWRPPAPSQEWA